MRKGEAACERARERLVLLLDGEGSVREREEVRAHVASCGLCAEEWKAILLLRDALRKERPIPAERERVAILEAARPLLDDLRAASRRAPIRLRPVGGALLRGAATLAAVVALAVLLSRGGKTGLRSADVRTYYEVAGPAREIFPLGVEHFTRPF